MPGSIAKAGLAQEILPLEAIGPVLRGHIAGPTS
jgi:two-component system chemotaxis response regulator CheB